MSVNLYDRGCCHLPIILLANLAAANLAANLSIAVPGVANLLFLTPQLQYGLAGQTWCLEHHRAAVERMVRTLPPAYPLPSCSGEIFEGLEVCNCRLRGYALAEGFDIVRKGGGVKANPSFRFRCIFHSSIIQNNRKLEEYIEKDSDSKIVGKHQREAMSVR
jgi:hypothetical protein